LAAGWAIARDLRTRGFDARDGRDVLGLVLRNEPVAVQLLRQSGRILGEVISDTVSILNPSVVVVGGTLSRAEHQLLAGIRELVYQRALPLATRDLIISPSQLPETGGILGAARLVIETRLHLDVLDGLIAQRS
jgi:glucokinase